MPPMYIDSHAKTNSTIHNEHTQVDDQLVICQETIARRDGFLDGIHMVTPLSDETSTQTKRQEPSLPL